MSRIIIYRSLSNYSLQSIRNCNIPEKSSKHKCDTYRYYVKADGEKKKFTRKLLLGYVV
jgi:hypothetical protein